MTDKNQKTKYPYWIIILLVVAVAIGIYFFVDSRRTKSEMSEMIEQMTFEKEQLEDEYEELAIQFDGYGKNIHNDSLAQLLNKEQQRVQDLLEELRITKATNAKRIAELKKELATVRAVLVEYVHQIDSLNATNKRLTAENKQVREQYEQVSEKANQLEQETNRLSEVVSRASMLEIKDFNVLTLDHRGKKTGRLSKIQKLQFNFTIAKNITTQAGVKTIYLRLLRPDGEAMYKNENNLFPYENVQLQYSVKKDIEYGGEEISEVLYWNVEEILQVGTYNADFFIDGNLCGSFPFSISK